MKHELRAEDSGFATSAPRVLRFDAVVAASRERVFEAVVADPQTWKAWFPGITGGRYLPASDGGVGATRLLVLAGVHIRETVLVHEEPYRWTYRVDAASVPIARAIVETWLFADVRDGTHVKWTFAIDPTLLFSLLPAPQRSIGALWRRAMRNLSAHLQLAR